MPQSRLPQSKEILRQKCKEIRLKLYNEGQIKEISEKITKKISELEEFKNARCVMLFYPKKQEIDVLGLLEFDKKFFLPRCEGDEIVICDYKKNDNLKKSEFGVYEPINKPIKNPGILDLIIVPALCADKNKNRLGYGKGFYDRFLSKKQIKAKTIVVVPKKLVFDDIKSDDFDVKCDMVISS